MAPYEKVHIHMRTVTRGKSGDWSLVSDLRGLGGYGGGDSGVDRYMALT